MLRKPPFASETGTTACKTVVRDRVRKSRDGSTWNHAPTVAVISHVREETPGVPTGSDDLTDGLGRGREQTPRGASRRSRQTVRTHTHTHTSEYDETNVRPVARVKPNDAFYRSAVGANRRSKTDPSSERVNIRGVRL